MAFSARFRKRTFRHLSPSTGWIVTIKGAGFDDTMPCLHLHLLDAAKENYFDAFADYPRGPTSLYAQWLKAAREGKYAAVHISDKQTREKLGWWGIMAIDSVTESDDGVRITFKGKAF